MDVLSLNDLDVLLRGVQQRMTAFLEETKAQPQLPGQFHSATIGFSLELDRVAAIIERLTFQPVRYLSDSHTRVSLRFTRFILGDPGI
eukprot:m.497205 g.497205  ORF g.497205 m.497205 type:complete len:88 (-) comp57312_c0_seq6:1343-1606(-)